MKKQTRSTVFLAQGAMIAAIYTVLTLLAATMNLAYGPVQFRFSEALTILPLFTPRSNPWADHWMPAEQPVQWVWGGRYDFLARLPLYWQP